MNEEYLADIRRYTSDVNTDAITTIVKYLGIALRSRDSSLVSCSDPDELARLRDGFCSKKLGLSANDADAAIAATCETMKGVRNKHRVTFYYLVAEASGTMGQL